MTFHELRQTMSFLTSFRILLVYQTLYQGAFQRTFPRRHVGQSYECSVHVDVYTGVSCKMQILRQGCEDLLYHFRVTIIDSNVTLLNSSKSTASLLDDVRTEMFKKPPRVMVCRDDKDILHGYVYKLSSVRQNGVPCWNTHPCLAYVPEFPAPINVKSLTITELAEITLHKTSFRSYPNVTILSLTNSDVYIDQDAFDGLSLLRTLTLSGDKITVLPHGLFSALEQLTELDVSRNRLGDISREHFATLRSLVTLDLSHNEIRTLGDDVFSTLPGLEVLSLSSNELESLPSKIFSETNSLANVDLSGNGIVELPREIFWNLRHLEVLNLSRCGLNSLHEDTFANSTSLKVLILSYNNLTILPDNILPFQFKLEVLDVSRNELRSWDANTLRHVSNLKTLLLNSNRLVSLPTNMLNSTRDLKILDVTENKLRSFRGKLINRLRYLDLLDASGNNIRYVEFAFYNSITARRLNFSRNEISSFDIRWHRFPYLETADFDWNNLTCLDLPVCVRPQSEIVFSFRHNRISHVRTYSVRQPERRNWNCTEQLVNTLFLAGNPLDCDCEMHPFYKQVTNLQGAIPYKFPDSDTWECDKPKFLEGSSFRSLDEDMFLCSVKDCPEPCLCGLRARDKRIIVNCTGKNLDAIPESAPENVSVLYFRGNKLTNLKLRKDVWQNLTELYLENNLLENVEATDITERLRILDLSGNRLKNVSLSLRNFVSLHQNVSLRLGNNRWNCTCSSKSLKDWLLNHKQNVEDPNDVTCEIMENGEIRNISLYNIPDKLLCPDELSRTIRIATFAGTISGTFLVIAGLALLLLYYKNVETVLAFLYGTSLFQCFFREDPEEEEEKIFDAFVAYSGKDREVAMKLVEELEGESPFFKLCIHERDWVAGQFISENILRSVQSSRRTVLILSEDFVSSSWFAVEVRAVLFQMLQDRVNRLLVVVVGSFPSLDEIENDVRQLLLRRTYLVWGERWFWEKIRYALPHKGQSKRSSGTKTHGTTLRLMSLLEEEVTGVLNQETRS